MRISMHGYRGLLLTALLLVLLIVGCTEERVIRDDDNTPDVPYVTKRDGDRTFVYGYDAMAYRGVQYAELDPIVYDPAYYGRQPFARGEIVYFRNPAKIQEMLPSKNIARIVGLPGEEIEIVGGQVYINGARLDAFYGQAHDVGKNRAEYIAFFKERPRQCDESCVEGILRDYFDLTIQPVTLDADELFVLGDNWPRAIDSKSFGPLQAEDVLGKVLGYMETDQASP